MTDPMRDALVTIRDTFQKDIDQGYKTRDKVFAIDIANNALSAPALRMDDARLRIVWMEELERVNFPATSHSIATLDAVRAFAARVREAVLEEAASVVEGQQETIREKSDGSVRYLAERKMGNLSGLAYADGIRALGATAPKASS